LSNEPETDVLDSVAASISDGARIEWEQVGQQVDATSDAVVDQLQHLERIAKFYRTADERQPDDAPGVEKESSGPRAWAHFLVLRRLGGGSSADVYNAHDTKLQCDVALKLMRHDGDSRANISRVLKEARLLARVRHTNVVTVYGADQLEGRVGLWMELVRGTTLEELLQRQGPFGAREASLIGLDLCRALAAVHRAGLLHGDIKAHNVMREEGGRTVLMDFGVGRDLDQEFPRQHIAPSTDFAGTPLYLAPEVFSGSRRTKVADVYSLGVLLFHLVSNRYPVEGETRAAIDEAHQNSMRTHLRDLRPDLPEEFVNLVERALDPDPRQRFQSAGAFEIALARFLGTSAENGTLAPRRIASAALAAVVATILIGVAIYWFAMRPRIAPAASAAIAAVSAPSATTASGSYSIDAGLYRVSDTGESKLQPGDRVAPGDRLTLQIQLSQPAHVYIVNEDDIGESYLLFPLPNQAVSNPIPGGRPVRLPAGSDSPLYWAVTSAGGREHFLIFATPEPLPVFDRMFASLPHPQLNAPVLASPMSAETVGGLLRGVGGLSKVPRPSGTKLADQFTTPLLQTAETANGLWVRQITVENPR
jgi:tRNA A-37 threonylcarbamoyl transferase component Bud32